MTATSAVIDNSVTSALPRWRLAWARRENDRRRRAHDDAVSAWQRHREHLLRLQIEAAEFHGCQLAHASLPVRFEDGEVVFRVVPTARLVEVPARHVRGLPVPDVTIGVSASPPEGRLPRGLCVIETGTVVVTDRRVAFAGADTEREWWYADVMGPAHHSDVPLTLLHTSDGRRLAGLLIEPAGVLNTRFYLTLAFAAATGRRADVVAEVDALLAAHQAARPTRPRWVRPADAPLTALRPDRGLTTAVAAAATLTALTAGVVDAEPMSPPLRTQAATMDATPAERPDPTDATTSTSVLSTTGTPPASTTPDRPAGTQTPGPVRVPPAVLPTAGGTVAPGTTTSPGSRPTSTTDPTPSTGPAPTTAPPSSPAPTTAPTTTPPPTSTPPPAEPHPITVCVGIPLPIVDPILCPGDE